MKYAPNTEPQKTLKEHYISLMTGPLHATEMILAPFLFYALLAYSFSNPANYMGMFIFSVLSTLHLGAMSQKYHGILAIPQCYKPDLFSDYRKNAECFLAQQMQNKKSPSLAFFANQTVENKGLDCFAKLAMTGS